MVITLTRTGGFTGIPFTKTIDTAQLPPDKAKELEDLVSHTNFSSSNTKNTTPDRFFYSLSIQGQESTQSLEISEDMLTPHIRELITYIDGVKAF